MEYLDEGDEMGEQKGVPTEQEKTFNTMAESKGWYCKQCQEPITYEFKESYYLTGYCPKCAQMICDSE